MRYRKLRDGESASKPGRKIDRLWKLIAAFVLLMAIYIIGIKFELKIVVYIYYALLFASSLAFIILNRGVEQKPPTPEMLPDSWDDEKKRVYIEEDTKRKTVARKLLYLVIPLLFIFAFDILYMALTANT